MTGQITTTRKALSLNLDSQIYGTFAEIGAGQEVARHFFQAGKASQTVAKTISAYDMTVSDSIYGKSSRYVSEERLRQMTDYEFDLMDTRLRESRSEDCRFFAFADTVATNSGADRVPHGWLGIRFQHAKGAAPSDIIIHVKIKDPLRLRQQELLGVLGVNLIYGAFFHHDNYDQLIDSLMDNLKTSSIEIDIVRLEGPCFKGIDNRLVALKLVEKGISQAALIDPSGKVMQVSDCFFDKPILVQRGIFRPITNINLEIINKGLNQLKAADSSIEPFPLMEMSLRHQEAGREEISLEDYLFRAESIGSVGFYSLISKFHLFYEVKNYLRESTRRKVAMLIGASNLESVFNEEFYQDIQGGILTALAQLFDGNSEMMVFPYKDEQICMTTATFNPEQKLIHLYRHLVSNEFIVDISGCDELDTSIHSKRVRDLLQAGDSAWKEMVPEPVSALIQKYDYFS